MGTSEAVSQVGRLVMAFGKNDISEERISIYVDELVDIHETLLRSAVDAIIRGSKFFPTIAEIRHAAARLSGMLPPSPAETLAIVRLADRTEIRGNERGGRGYVEKFWEWPESVSKRDRELIEDVIARVGEPSDLDGKQRFGWEMGFQKTYEVEAKQIEATVLSDLSTARLAEGYALARLASENGTSDTLKIRTGLAQTCEGQRNDPIHPHGEAIASSVASRLRTEQDEHAGP